MASSLRLGAKCLLACAGLLLLTEPSEQQPVELMCHAEFAVANEAGSKAPPLPIDQTAVTAPITTPAIPQEPAAGERSMHPAKAESDALFDELQRLKTESRELEARTKERKLLMRVWEEYGVHPDSGNPLFPILRLNNATLHKALYDSFSDEEPDSAIKLIGDLVGQLYEPDVWLNWLLGCEIQEATSLRAAAQIFVEASLSASTEFSESISTIKTQEAGVAVVEKLLPASMVAKSFETQFDLCWALGHYCPSEAALRLICKFCGTKPIGSERTEASLVATLVRWKFDDVSNIVEQFLESGRSGAIKGIVDCWTMAVLQQRLVAVGT